MKTIPLCFSCGMIAFLMGCNSNSHPTHRKEPKPIVVDRQFTGSFPMRVVSTTGMVAELVRRVGGPRVQVEQLLGADVDPHTYQSTAADVSKLGQADLIFYNGLHLEGKMAEIFAGLGRKIPTFGVGDYLHPDRILGEVDGDADPHIWFDVKLWSQGAAVVSEVLVQFDPENALEYQQRLGTYQAELDKLHVYALTELATIPVEKRVLVTSHDAFRYFGRAYIVEVKGIQGISTQAEASVKDINDLVEFICQRQVKAVFVETSVNQRNMRSLMEGCQANGHKVILGGELFSDAMGKENTPEGTYEGMIRHNVDTIVRALK